MTDFDRRIVQTARLRMDVVDQGSGPAVLLLHGFPESAYSWRLQIPALARAGYRVIAPDQRGYGRTDAPEAIEAYALRELCADLMALLDTLGVQCAHVVGHDWGAPVAWHTALWYPERVGQLCTLSVPYGGRPPRSPLAVMRERMADSFFYQLYFQEPGLAEAEMDADVRESLRRFYYASSGEVSNPHGFAPHAPGSRVLDTMQVPDGLPGWLSETDMDVYVTDYARGFRGPINWYRNFDLNWEQTADLQDVRISQPTLFIVGARDSVLAFGKGQMKRMHDVVDDLRVEQLEGIGHWVQQEAPEQLNALLLEHLKGRA